MPSGVLRTVLLTVLTMLAFAANSILCRAALRDGAIDPVGFTTLRLASGALVLLPFLQRRAQGERRPWRPAAAAALFVYALGFSLAYVSLDAGTGALLAPVSTTLSLWVCSATSRRVAFDMAPAHCNSRAPRVTCCGGVSQGLRATLRGGTPVAV